MHAVDNRLAIGAGRQDAEAEAGQHRQAFGRVGRLQVLHQVGGSHHQAGDAFGRGGDLLGVQHAERGFHHAHDAHRRGRAGGGHAALQVGHHGGALHLGQQDGIGARGRHGLHVVTAPGAVEGVHPHDQFAVAVAAGGDRLNDLPARQVLGIGRHRVFQIQDQRVGRQGAALFQGAGIGAGHVEDGTARTGAEGHWRKLPFGVLSAPAGGLAMPHLRTRGATINKDPPVASCRPRTHARNRGKVPKSAGSPE